MLTDSFRLVRPGVHAVVLVFLGLSSTSGTSEDILVLLFGEVDVIVTVSVGELGWVPSVILVERVRSECLTVVPSLELEIADRAASVVVGNLHGASVGLVVNDLSASMPLLLLTKALKNMIWADLHDGNLLGSAVTTLGLASLEVADLTIATTGDHGWDQSHELSVLHDWRAGTTLTSTEGSCLAVGDPVVMGLVVLVVLLEGVIQGTVEPVELRDGSEVEGHLRVLIGLVVVASTDWVDLLVDVRVDDRVAQVVVGLLVVVLGEVRRVEVDCRHLLVIKQTIIINICDKTLPI